MNEKLIKDAREIKRIKFYTISNVVGIIFCILGLMAILLKGITTEYIDESGILHENFFLLPIGFAFILLGIIIILISLLYYSKKSNNKYYILTKFGYLLSSVSLIMTLLIYSNGNRISILTLALTIVGISLIIVGKLKKINKIN